MRLKTHLKGARIIDPSQGIDRVADLLVSEDGHIEAIESPGQINLSNSASSPNPVIDLKDHWISPGLVDMHVHLREPGEESKETIQSGSQAALAGGFTSIACMANTNPVNDSGVVTQFIKSRAKEAARCRVYPIGAVSKGLQGESLADIGSMVQEGAIAISDDGMPVMNSLLMRKAMEYAKTFDVPIITHSEDLNLVAGAPMNEGIQSFKWGFQGNPNAAEEIMIAREIALARLTGCHIHIAHLTTREGVEHVRRAKEDGVSVTAEVCPHHLFLTDEGIPEFDTHYKMAPPLRSELDTLALKEGLKDGTLDVIATDHAPHGPTDKDRDFGCASCGVIGLESALGLSYRLVDEGYLSLPQLIQKFTSAPSQILKIGAGTLKVGAPADFTVIRPYLGKDSEWVFEEKHIRSKSKNSPFLGWKMNIRPWQTWVGGQLEYQAEGS